jgi:ketosteroid isomerase-like protein
VNPAVAQFIACINRQDVDGLFRLMTPDHLFVDSLDIEVRGREPMRAGGRAYFAMVPDYRIVVTDHLETGPVVALFGRAGGTYAPDGGILADKRWEIPAAWKAVVHGDLIAEWRVYADNDPVRRLMASSTV